MPSCRRGASRPKSQARKARFFKVILPSTISDGQLEIPVEFVRKFGEELSDSAVLKVPNGKEWAVDLKKNDGIVWFHNDVWQRFIEYYNISVWYFIVFRYYGDSKFLAIILNHNGCEIKYPLQESHLQDKCLMIKNEEREEEYIQPRVKKQGKSSSTYSGGPASKPDCLAQKKRKRKETVGKGTMPNAVGEEVTKNNQQTAQRSGSPPSQQCLANEYEWAALRKRRPVTEKERKGAISAAQSFKTTNPSFMVIMKPSYLRKGLNVPLVFAREHFTDGAHSVKLRLPNGRTWCVRFFLCSNIKALLSGGWNAFARENVLLEGDCCVFEVLKKKEIEMKVSIFRVVDDWVPLVGSVTAKMRNQVIFKENKATQAAREFKSEYPFYTAYIRQSYVKSCLMIIKADFIRAHLTNEVETVTLQDSDGTKWSVKCIIKDGQGKLGGGWAEFASKKNIEQGDVCAFELIEKMGIVLKVTIFKSH
ncbi:hypothetical protein NE237_023569 [Protea cynaroides]|uniref:TF-B3 domain-containing protein n=1 Tax=Protea cynaroides TaxID=273540 RepID=A0A9Q0HD60_9MAGN|nr:hypothetical protein NE237_023569 [Protea cynaroides]